MHIGIEQIREAAEDIGNGWKRTPPFELHKGDTAYAPGTTKYNLQAHNDGATVFYVIAPDGGMGGYIDGPVGRVPLA